MSIEEVKVKSSVKIYNSFIQNGGEYQLTLEELYFYTLLAVKESKFLGYTETTLNLLSEEQPVFTDSNKNRNVNKIKNILIKLSKMGVIEIKPDDEKIVATTRLRISFPFLGVGYEHIYREFWEMVSNPNELLVLLYIQRFKSKGGFQKSKEEWASMLGYDDERTGIGIINKMIAEGKIYSVEGKKYIDRQGGNKQHPTKWFMGKKPEPASQVSEIEQCIDAEEENQQESEDKSETNIPTFIEVHKSQGRNKVSIREKFSVADIISDINKWESKLYYEHFYYTNKYKDADPKTYSQFQKRRKALETKGGWSFDQFENQFYEDMQWENKQMIEEQQEKLLEEHGHLLIYKDKSIGIIDNVDDWSQIKEVRIGNSYYPIKDDESREFIINELRERKQLNAEIWDEMAAKWKSIKSVNESKNNESHVSSVPEEDPDTPKYIYKSKKDPLDISDILDEGKTQNNHDDDFSDIETDDPCLQLFVDSDKTAKENLDQVDSQVKNHPNAWLHELKAKRTAKL